MQKVCSEYGKIYWLRKFNIYKKSERNLLHNGQSHWINRAALTVPLDLIVTLFVFLLVPTSCPVIIKIQIDLHSVREVDLNDECATPNTQYINCQGFGYFDRYLHFSQQSPFMIWLCFGYWRRNLCLCTWNSFRITNLCLPLGIVTLWLMSRVCFFFSDVGLYNTTNFFFGEFISQPLFDCVDCQNEGRRPLALKIDWQNSCISVMI